MPPKSRKSKKRPRPTKATTATPPSEDWIDPNLRDEIIATFEAHATDEGTMSISTAKKSYKSLGIDVKSDDIQSWLTQDEDDNNNDYCIHQDQFLQFARDQLQIIEKAKKAFELIDQDGKGLVVLQDLQRVSQELGEAFTDDELQEMIAMFDKSNDGLLRPKDFVRIARQVNL